MRATKMHFSDTSKQAFLFALMILTGAVVGWFLIPAPTEAPPKRSTAEDKVGAAGQGRLPKVDQSTFDQQVLGSTVPVLVDFYADWCGPCQQLTPVLESLARENTSARVVRVDVEENQALADRYGITAIPRLMVFRNGQIISDATGVVDRSRLEAMLGK